MSKIKVTGCKDCPFLTNGFFFSNCGHPSESGFANALITYPKTPSWCPLKKEHITIEIEQ